MKKLSRRGMFIFASIIGILLVVFLVSALALVIYGLRDSARPADVAIVLGNRVEDNGEPSPRLRARLDRAAELHRQGLVRWILVSGATGKNGYDESGVMLNYLVRVGIPRAVIVRDEAGADTWLTARNAARIMRQRGWHGAIVVSQFFHLARARLALARCGVAPVTTAHARYFEPRDLYSTARDTIAFYYYLMRPYRVKGA